MGLEGQGRDGPHGARWDGQILAAATWSELRKYEYLQRRCLVETISPGQNMPNFLRLLQLYPSQVCGGTSKLTHLQTM